jgi:hypothetical protein
MGDNGQLRPVQLMSQAGCGILLTWLCSSDPAAVPADAVPLRMLGLLMTRTSRVGGM